MVLIMALSLVAKGLVPCSRISIVAVYYNHGKRSN